MTPEHVVTFEEWESERVKLDPNEVFKPIFGEILTYNVGEGGELLAVRRVLGYRGDRTGIRVGTWFAEVMEPL